MNYKVKVNSIGDKEWFLNEDLHREDGPAIEKINGDKYWFINGKRHREDGPAAEWVSGGKQWWLNGKLHREDGPAIEWSTGAKYWYLHGKRLTKEAWLEMLPEDLKIKALFSENFIKR